MNRITCNNRRARMVSAVGSHTQEEWQAIKECQDFRCLACNRREPEIELTIDHVTPLSKGGSNYASNIQGLCRSCNCSKHDKVFDFRKPT